MKIYEALFMLQRYPQAYFLECVKDDSWFPCVYTKDTEGNFRSTHLVNAIRGNRGSLLSFGGYNAKETQRLLTEREFELCYSYEGLFNIFVRLSQKSLWAHNYTEVEKLLKLATKKGKVTRESAEELLNRYKHGVPNV